MAVVSMRLNNGGVQSGLSSTLSAACSQEWELTRIIDADMSNIEPLCEQLQFYCNARSGEIAGPRSTGAKIHLVLKKLLTSIVMHACQDAGTGRIEVRTRLVEPYLEILIIDQGAASPHRLLMSPDKAFEPDVNSSRSDGGAGLDIVRAIIPNIEYQRIAGKNRLLLRKELRCRGGREVSTILPAQNQTN